jgi:hypothetical protein
MEGNSMMALLAVDWGWVSTGVLGAVLWIVLLIFLGLRSLRRGHWVMFLVGLVFPLFWLIGALIPARR